MATEQDPEAQAALAEAWQAWGAEKWGQWQAAAEYNLALDSDKVIAVSIEFPDGRTATTYVERDRELDIGEDW
jgi:hypothetical protein